MAVNLTLGGFDRNSTPTVQIVRDLTALLRLYLEDGRA